MILKLKRLIEDSFLKEKSTQSLGKQLLTKIEKELAYGSREGKKFFVVTKYPIVKNFFENTLKIDDIDDLEFARQITLMDHYIYKNIKPVELFNLSWSKEKLKHRGIKKKKKLKKR
jgi:hypothetical protein